jgi:outer membrane protein TolC
MKWLTTATLVFTFFYSGFTQTGKFITLASCYQKAIALDPTQKQLDLLDQANQLQLDKINLQQKPTITWNANASLQSEAIALPFELPNLDVPELPLYRIQTSLDAQYTVYDGGFAEAQQTIVESSLKADQFAIKVQAEQIKPQINKYFFGILLLEEQEKILLKNLESLLEREKQLEASVEHGVVLESELKKVQVELLRLNTQIDKTRGDANGLRNNLSYLIGEPLTDSTQLQLPETANFSTAQANKRLELELFSLQKEKVLAQEGLITASRKPKFGVFAQAGVGYPNPLNFFDDNIKPFAVIGAQFSWKIIDWKMSDKDRQLLSVQNLMIDNQRENFEYRLKQFDEKTKTDIQTIELQIEKGEQIVSLQNEIAQQLAAQLDNGIITATDYLLQVNAVIQAELNLKTQQLQIEQIKVNYLTQKGLL